LISWSPDSTRLATWVDLWSTIGIYGLDGARQALLTLPLGLMAPGDNDPVWSPDGTSLLVPHGVEIPLDGSTPRALPGDDPRSHPHSYSPDGTQVAYTARDGSLNVAAADGSHARILIPVGVQASQDQDLAWSPTGDRIVLASLTGHAETDWGPATELHLVDMATGTVTSLAGQNGYDTLRVVEFSPEGDRILFSRTVARPGAETNAEFVSSLWSVNADGSDARMLVTAAGQGGWQAVSQARG
jgi:Tol biopolymer transport system component